MSKVVACIIARTVSKRLPLKVLRDIRPDLSMLDFLVQRIKSVQEIDEIYICTSLESCDDILEDIALRNGVKLYRGSSDAVIERMVSVGESENADIILRITGDNPLATIEYLPQQISFLKNSGLDYVRVVDIPIGATVEVISFDALKKCYKMMDPTVSEYLMLFLFEPNDFKCGIIKVFDDDYSSYSLTVDTNDDLTRTRRLLAVLPEQLNKIFLKDILKLYIEDKLDLPSKLISKAGNVKMPYDKVILFEDFQKDMNRRKENSKYLKLNE